MRNPLPLILIIAGLGGFICSSSVFAATVRKIDDSTVNGELMSIGDGKLTIGVKSDIATTKPTTMAVIGPATRAATQASTQATTKPASIALSDIVQVVLHDPPAKAPPKPPVAAAVPAPNNDSDDESDGVLSFVFHALFTSSKSTPADVQVQVTQVTQEAVVQPATMPAKRIAASSPASQPAAVAIHWQVSLIGGDALHGRIDGWSGQKMIFRLDADAARSIALPADQLASAWCGDSAAQSKAQSMMGEPGPEDIAFVKKDADVVMVKGLALGIEGDSLHFTHDEQDRKISLGKLVGIAFGTTGRHLPAAHFHQLVKLDSGDQISGTWTGITADSISLQTAWGSLLQLPVKSVYTIDFVDGRLAYLSDLKPDKVEQTPYFGRVIPWRANQSLAGGPLMLSDGQYAKGIAVHSRCVLEYDINRAYRRFQCKVGFEQPMGKRGRAVIRVLGDGKVLFENQDARGDQSPAEISIDVSNIQRLTLEVDFGKQPDVGGRVVWANARLLRPGIPE